MNAFFKLVLVTLAVVAQALTARPAEASTGDGAPADTHIVYVGRWDRSSPTQAVSYYGGAYLRVNFNGTRVAVKLAAPANFYASINGGPDVLYEGRSGTVNLTPTPLANGTHSLRIAAKYHSDVLKFQGLALDSGAWTSPPAARPNTIEFVGGSIVAGYLNSKQALSDFAWLIGEQLGTEHTQVAYTGICLVDQIQCYSPNAIGMSRQFFKQKTVDHPGAPDWDFGAYQPRAVVINLGTNDSAFNVSAATFQAAYTSFLQGVRAKYPSAQIFAMRLFNGAYADQTRAAVQARVAAGDGGVRFIDTSNWLVPADFTDGTHPNDAGHAKLAKLLGPLLKPHVGGFFSSFEQGEAVARTNAVEGSANVSNAANVVGGMDSGTSTSAARAGVRAFRISGNDLSATQSFSYNRLHDVSMPVAANTVLSYWIRPENANGRFTAVDVLFTDGSWLRNLGAVDQRGITVHPHAQGAGGQLQVGNWNLVTSRIGAVAAGKTIQRIAVGYDQPAATGVFGASVDELSIAQTPFATGFETTDVPPTWSDTVRASANVGGYCCGKTAMESSPRVGATAHTGAGSLLYQGRDNSATQSYSYNRVFAVNIPVTPTTNLSYWLFPLVEAGSGTDGSHVAIDLLFSDGTWLRNTAAVDQNGIRLSPSQQGAGRRLVKGAWNLVSSNVGAVAAGKTIVEINVGYDRADATGAFKGYLDDLLIF
jgi:GDSL-like Lipase/Acylhydrolase family/Carbohydrate esterase 2 N-terminal